MSRTQKRLWAFTSARLRRLSTELRRLLNPQLDDAADLRAEQIAEAEELTRAAAGLRGGVAKIAQLRAYLQGAAALGPEAQQILSRLWDHAPGDEPAAIRQVLIAELGAPPEKLFARFEEAPLAAASLGQVHAAVLADGREVAVKIQYPGVAVALRDDLDSRGVLRQLVGGDLGGALPADSIAALRQHLLAEVDYKAEAASLRRFASAYSEDDTIVIPKVVPELSTERVLTMDRLRGKTLPEIMRQGDLRARSAVAATLFRFAFSSPIIHGLINVDPNPGNYLILDAAPGPRGEARVGFIDFGCTAELPEELRVADRDLWMAMIHRDGEALRHAAHREGLIPSATSFNSSTYRTFENLLGSPFLNRGEVELTADFVKILGETTWLLVHSRQLELPPAALLLWRQRLSVLAVLSSLRPRLDFRRALATVLDDHSHPTPLLERYP